MATLFRFGLTSSKAPVVTANASVAFENTQSEQEPDIQPPDQKRSKRSFREKWKITWPWA